MITRHSSIGNESVQRFTVEESTQHKWVNVWKEATCKEANHGSKVHLETNFLPRLCLNAIFVRLYEFIKLNVFVKWSPIKEARQNSKFMSANWKRK